jgi:hypothetical protein
MAAALSVTQLFDSLAIRIDGQHSWDTSVSIRWQFSDTNQTYRMELSNGALIHFPTRRDDPADLVVTLTHRDLLHAIGRGTTEGAAHRRRPVSLQHHPAAHRSTHHSVRHRHARTGNPASHCPWKRPADWHARSHTASVHPRV